MFHQSTNVKVQMGEAFLFQIAGQLLGKITSLSLRHIFRKWGVETDVNRMEVTLSVIKAVLLDADDRQVKSKHVRDWLEKLQDVLYDIDDVLDDFMTEDLRLKVQKTETMMKDLRNYVSSLNPFLVHVTMSSKIKKISKRLEEIAANRRDFQFTERIVDVQSTYSRLQSHSFVLASDVVGRISDMEKIIELLQSSGSPEDNLSVIPIIGLGGIGKTTLVQSIYNDYRVLLDFEIRIWVCVPEDFDLKKLIERILLAATNINHTHLDMEQLQLCLRKLLDSKKFLLVLDNVWNEDPSTWMDLRDLLVSGAKGSSVIVTTRIKSIGLFVGTVEPYALEGLSDDDCLLIFMKYAFKRGGAREYPKLEEIGRQIVSKCRGVPLAVRTLGSLLCANTDEKDWLFIRDNDMWEIAQKENDVLPIMRLSYDNIPMHLKQCFAYCSMFPKACHIPREILINLWIAQGFVQEDRGGELEDVGRRYFRELLSRSFFQDFEKAFDSEIVTCRMHDIMHDLAQSVAGKAFLKLNFEHTQIISERVRHIVFCDNNLSEKEFPRFLLKLEKLRSFTLQYKVGNISKAFLENIFKTFKCLRVLDLGDSEFQELPDSVGMLKHLRYLGLANNRSIMVLPGSVCNLLNLQTLDLSFCEKLQRLPSNFGNWCSLRHLSLTSTMRCLPEKSLASLSSLRFLSITECKHLVSLSEGMGYLNTLRELYIKNCPCLTSLPGSMSGLPSLEKLWIWDCEQLLWLGKSMYKLPSLKSFLLWALPKLRVLPYGIGKYSANLKYLSIQDCPSLEALPNSFTNCTFLFKLEIVNCPLLQRLPPGMHQLTLLKQLCIRGCPHLTQRYIESDEYWPEIKNIPELYTDKDI